MSRANPFAAHRVKAGALCGCIFAFGLLSGCDDSGKFNPKAAFAPKPEAGQVAEAGEATTLVERDVEAPDVFSATEPGLWDGRPSLGGVWVAHPDVTAPERVMIRNQANGKFVVGALFRREREIPGPRLQISSDAATALGVLAGAPVELNVTALRKEAVAEEPQVASAEGIAAPDEVTQTPLDPIAAAGAAIDASEPSASQSVEPLPAATPAPAPKPAASDLKDPYVQVGIFSVEANAERAAKQVRGSGVSAQVKQQEAGGKPFWRVLVGPAANSQERESLLKKIKGEGYTDAYAVAN